MTNQTPGQAATPCLICSQVSHHVARNILIAGAEYECVNTLVTKMNAGVPVDPDVCLASQAPSMSISASKVGFDTPS
jgi:hypothetical protein